MSECLASASSRLDDAQGRATWHSFLPLTTAMYIGGVKESMKTRRSDLQRTCAHCWMETCSGASQRFGHRSVLASAPGVSLRSPRSDEKNIRGSIVVSIPACHAGNRGSIPRRGVNSFFVCFEHILSHITSSSSRKQVIFR